MAASLSLRVCTGTDAGTVSSAVTGIDLISADNAVNSAANRAANPVGRGTNSYEKWMLLEIDVAPANDVSNFQVWGDGGALDTDIAIDVAGEVAAGVTPVATTSVVATTDWTTVTAAAKLQWDTTVLTTIGQQTKFLVMQLQVGASAAVGSMTQEVANYSYDES